MSVRKLCDETCSLVRGKRPNWSALVRGRRSVRPANDLYCQVVNEVPAHHEVPLQGKAASLGQPAIGIDDDVLGEVVGPVGPVEPVPCLEVLLAEEIRVLPARGERSARNDIDENDRRVGDEAKDAWKEVEVLAAPPPYIDIGLSTTIRSKRSTVSLTWAYASVMRTTA